MPGLCLTTPQAQRLWGLDLVVCEAVLEALVEAGFLRHTRDGFYCRAGDDTAPRPLVRPFVSR
ncbi:MAG: hypothetical protein HYY76_13415 [Acidobacteria bacterium]|nr:hypothetical protein [Acidobacteriota bacterium]